MAVTPDPIFCRGGCGSSQPDVKECLQVGWSFLHINGGYRCGTCEGALWRASTQVGALPRNEPDRLPRNEPDRLPPDSIGALKKLPEREPLKEKVNK